MNGVLIYLDEQKQSDHILIKSIRNAESLGATNFYKPDADYHFVKKANLEFQSSGSQGIQIADILAGLFMSFYGDKQAGLTISGNN